jgi:hypothetical protein
VVEKKKLWWRGGFIYLSYARPGGKEGGAIDGNWTLTSEVRTLADTSTVVKPN